MTAAPHVLVIGDVMLDCYISGTADRLSPEAPVPVVRVKEEWSSLGGAANVAANVAALGESVMLVGLVGRDPEAVALSAICRDLGIEIFLQETGAPTITKTRVMSNQQIVRIDRESPLAWPEDAMLELEGLLETLTGRVRVVLLSDYAKGTISARLVAVVMRWANVNAITVITDPKRPDWSFYGQTQLLTPNLKELGWACGRQISNDDQSVVSAAREILGAIEAEHVLVTRSEEGMMLVGNDVVLNIPAHEREVFDVSGAGDTVLATIGASLSQGHPLAEALIRANAAAAIAVSKRGTAVVPQTELRAVFSSLSAKIIDRKSVPMLRDRLKNVIMVFTNGCFDVLHEGHRKLLREARNFGDILVVGINSDMSVRKLKGANRPINNEQVRASLLAGLSSVDYVVIFDDETPLELIRTLRPDVLVKGGDYEAESVVGRELVSEVRIVQLVQDLSTTGLLTN